MNEALEREVLLSARNIGVAFGRGRYAFHAVRGVSFDIYRGETFGIVGESGSGKTTIGRTIMRIQPLSTGEILFKGQRISGRIPHALDQELTRQSQMISLSVNPTAPSPQISKAQKLTCPSRLS